MAERKVKGKEKTKNINPKTKSEKNTGLQLPLSWQNYYLILIGLLIVIMGYVLMAGKGDIYSFRKITLSVIFVIGGFLFIIYAIMKKTHKAE